MFLNTTDSLHYAVNGYKVENNILHLNTIVYIDNQLTNIGIKLSSNGTLAV